MLCSSRSKPSAAGNTVQHNQDGGISVVDYSGGTFERNRIESNGERARGNGVLVTTGSNPTFSKNTVGSNVGRGFQIMDHGSGAK